MNARLLLLAAPAVAVSLLAREPEARACGGCAVPPDTNTQVTGHRMILAASKAQTTLYDQIEYSGEPESFAWFLPIKGQVDVGLSADAMFALLADASQVVVFPPPVACVSSGRGGLATAEASDGAGSDVYVPPEETVNVIASETVGPYETVQLESKVPGALASWLGDHGYFIPADVKPVIDAYESEGFDFLAMKLVPGQGVSSMRPVRITSPGSALALPLRMVAAGTGAITPVLLHVVSEGRYEVQDGLNLRVPVGLVSWDWDQSLSNYREIRDALLGDEGGVGWLTESADHFDKASFFATAQYTIQGSPGTTGWGDPANGVSELDDAKADIDTLFAGMDEKSVWLTSMYARLSRAALAKDLALGASAEQAPVSRFITATYGFGAPPPCPPGNPFFGCATSPAQGGGTAALLAGTGLLAALAFARRRRR